LIEDDDDYELTSLKANGKPRTPAPMNDMNILATIFMELLDPDPAAGSAILAVKTVRNRMNLLYLCTNAN
jgi:hypothetical protein